MFAGAMGAMLGNPCMANDSAAKAYVLILGESLDYDFQKLGLNVTVLMPGPTDTPVLSKFGFDAATMPMKPLPIDQCVAEGLAALSANRAICIPGCMNRIMLTLMQHSFVRKMFEQVIANKSASQLRAGRAAWLNDSEYFSGSRSCSAEFSALFPESSRTACTSAFSW